MEEHDRQQLFFMREAISFSLKGRYLSPPNPWVGALIVKDNRIISAGWHEGPGTLHAEEVAIRGAEKDTDFSSCLLYVTLEPCSHFGKRPPCVDLLIRQCFKKVIVGIKDPDVRVAGQGIEKLLKAGIETIVGIGRQEVERSLSDYLYQRSCARPRVVLKTALSIDGCFSAKDGSSQWITDEESRLDAAMERAASQAIIVGSKTVIRDNPLLTVRHPNIQSFNPPLRVVLDSSGRVSGDEKIFCTQEAPTLYVTTDRCPKKLILRLNAKDVETITLQGKFGFIDLVRLIEILQRKNCLRILVEGGAAVHGAFLREKLADFFIVYYGPCILGEGHRGFSMPSLGIHNIAEKYVLTLDDVHKVGRGFRADYSCPR
ncbi:MAG: bifunctional diaminohydroxyphosphoribosylaminopyrimidine deaminase/5-amino-6-(5-phosphoribosylamino)uracil reductase RibD [Victivallaceae bacterium]